MIMPIPDVTAPACYPGAGSADLAVKQQQLLQLQISSRRPSASSLNLTLNSPISQRRNSRHLIPHHNFEHGGNGGPNNHQDTLGYGSPLASRRSSVGSIASGLYPTPSLPLQSGLNSNFSTSHQSSVSSWTALSQNRRPSVQSMSDIEFIPGAVPKTGQSQKRRGSTFSIASDGLALSTRDRKKAVPSRMMKLGQGYDISTMFHVEPQS
ncbi:hypothetical protein BGZ76_002450 [Entomortierella beljakovae]|nr:hypothetical protein BGZ76_002450 [Entomortierella beljakovae]